MRDFNHSVNVLVKAYLNDTLAHKACTACAVGNIIGDALGGLKPKVDEYNKLSGFDCFRWNNNESSAWWWSIEHYRGNRLGDCPEGDREIEQSGYSIEEIDLIEKAFEQVPLPQHQNLYWCVDDAYMLRGQLDGTYYVSNYGRIKHTPVRVNTYYGSRLTKEKILRTKILPSGYEQINITIKSSTKTLYIHRAVATAFIPNPLYKTTVNHKNCNKADNHVDNLEWATCAEQSRHAVQNNRCSKTTTPRAVLQLKDGRRVGFYHSIRSAGRLTGFSPIEIGRICQFKRQHIQGFVFRYVKS